MFVKIDSYDVEGDQVIVSNGGCSTTTQGFCIYYDYLRLYVSTTSSQDVH